MNANQQLIAKAIERGLIHVSPKLSTEAYLKRQVRESYHAKGLTSTGRKPAKRSIPQLAGMFGREYHRNYMRLVRAEKRAAA